MEAEEWGRLIVMLCMLGVDETFDKQTEFVSSDSH